MVGLVDNYLFEVLRNFLGKNLFWGRIYFLGKKIYYLKVWFKVIEFCCLDCVGFIFMDFVWGLGRGLEIKVIYKIREFFF